MGYDIEKEKRAPLKPEELEKAKLNLQAFLKDFVSKVNNMEYKVSSDDEYVYVTLNGEDAGKLIGYRGETLNSMQAILTAIANKQVESRVHLVLDIEGYRAKRQKALEELADKDTFMEVQSGFAKNIIVGFMRMEGHTVGVVANQPEFMAGSLDYNAGDKGGRFIRFCDCFNIPILTLVDVPAFLPGKSQEYNGIIRHGAKLLYAYSEATVPMVTVILRKAFGGAYIGMDSKGIGADFVFAWPIAQIAVMGAEGAVNIIAKRKIEESEDPEAARAEAIAEYENKFMNPYVAASRGYVDEVIRPDETKERVVKAFDMLSQKNRVKIPKKHGNMPV